METIKGAVYPRLESEILRLQVEEAEAEAEDENEQIRKALKESILEEALHTAKQEAEAKEKAEAEAKEAEKTVGGYNPQTPAERRAARLAALDRLEAAAKAKPN
jgi:hypothetical protein